VAWFLLGGFAPADHDGVFWAFHGLSEAKTGVTIPYPLCIDTDLVIWFFMTSIKAVTVSGDKAFRRHEVLK
jgi:hypothetical protein